MVSIQKRGGSGIQSRGPILRKDTRALIGRIVIVRGGMLRCP